jgi:hypothetical protein
MKKANPVNVSNLILQSPADSLREAKPMQHIKIPIPLVIMELLHTF